MAGLRYRRAFVTRTGPGWGRPGMMIRVLAVLCASVMAIVAAQASPAAARGRPGAARSSRARATAPIGPFTVNVANREDARQFYNQVYQGI